MSVIGPGEGRKQNRSGTVLGVESTAVNETESHCLQARIAPGPLMAETGHVPQTCQMCWTRAVFSAMAAR